MPHRCDWRCGMLFFLKTRFTYALIHSLSRFTIILQTITTTFNKSLINL